MKTDTIEIVDHGSGPQLSTTRLTVLDIFYYLNRGYDFDFIHMAMPTLSREEFDVVAAYVDQHREALIEMDRQADEWIQRGIEEQKAKGMYREIDESIPVEERAAKLRERLRQRLAEKNGGHATR